MKTEPDVTPECTKSHLYGLLYKSPITWVAVLAMVITAVACNDKQGPKDTSTANIKVEEADTTMPGGPTEVPSSVYEGRSVEEVLKLVAYRQLKDVKDGEYIKGTWEEVQASRPPENMSWHHTHGVTLYGLMYANEKVFHDPEILNYVKKHNEVAGRQWEYLTWQINTFGKYTNDGTMGEFVRLFMLDHCGAIVHQMLESIVRHQVQPTSGMQAIIDRTEDYIANKQGRINNAFWRPESMGGTLWIDDLYMGCPVLLKLYQHTGNKKYLEDAIYQIKTYASYAQDQDGLYYHGYFFEENEPSACKWGRANGWTIIAMVEVLSVMPEDHPEKEALIAILKKHIDGLVASQDPSGLWHQVLDHPELWLETSCTSMFAYAITRAVNRGWIGQEYLQYAKKAFEGINTRITEDGGIIGVSEGSSIGRDLEFYMHRKRPFDGHHGPGPVLLALTELLLSEQNSPTYK